MRSTTPIGEEFACKRAFPYEKYCLIFTRLCVVLIMWL